MQRKWAEEGFNVDDWRKFYEIPYKCCISTRLQSLQYRILNRYIPTRKYLFTRDIIGSKLCRKCFVIDDLKHFFYECPDVAHLWGNILRQLKNMFELPDYFINVETIFFGFLASPSVVNLIILVCKQYIVNRKLGTNVSDTTIAGAINAIQTHFNAENMIAKRQGKLEKHRTKWEKIFDTAGNIKLVGAVI